MGYGFDLVHLPSGVDRMEAYKKNLEEQEARALERSRGLDNLGPLDPSKEQVKQRLATALMAKHPSLELSKRDYAKIAKARSIDEAEARRRFRNLEVNEKRWNIQINLFDDTAGISLAFVGDGEESRNALRVVWDCLQVLESEGGFSTYDPQAGKVLNLESDFDTVFKYYAGDVNLKRNPEKQRWWKFG